MPAATVRSVSVGFGEGGVVATVELDPGIVIGQDGTSVLEQLRELMSKHRAWERFVTSV